MIRIISALLLSLFATATLVQASEPIQLAKNAPDSHVVVRGDTLWGISAMFLKDPWRWPEIWRMNKQQIKNPHWIYPGQVVVLDLSGAQPRLRLGRVVKLEPKEYVTHNTGAIPSIPQHIIEPFLSEPLVIEKDGLKNAPKIIATEEDHVIVGPDDLAYVTHLKGDAKLWQIYRPAQPLVDPETNKILGYEAFYLGTARKIRDGEPATIKIVTAKEEISSGDLLTPAHATQLVNYVPHAPATMIRGSVVSVYGGVSQAGRNSIICINRGTRDGIEVGHVLALYRKAAEVVYRGDDDKKTTYKLPEERYGIIFVFRTFAHVSYALVMNTTRPVEIADIVRTP